MLNILQISNFKFWNNLNKKYISISQIRLKGYNGYNDLNIIRTP
jgi:hypothetical protein